MSRSTRDTTTTLARSITWVGSKQTYAIVRLMVDRDLVNDFFRAYAYFRWVDDIVDAPTSRDAPSVDLPPLSRNERISFIKRQRALIDRLYQNERLDDLTPEERIVADLISHDLANMQHPADKQYSADRLQPVRNSRLQSFIRNMFAIIEFDAYRRGRLISRQELIWYSDCLGKSVIDGLQYFIGHGHPYPATDDRYLAATAAHITHLLRDMRQDIADGFTNIPHEYLTAQSIGPEDVDSSAYRTWVRGRVEKARRYFRDGKRYIDTLSVLRCKIVGHWYCARFESILDRIERDGYVLRAEYSERRKPTTWLRIVWLGITVAIRHVIRRGHRA